MQAQARKPARSTPAALPQAAPLPCTWSLWMAASAAPAPLHPHPLLLCCCWSTSAPAPTLHLPSASFSGCRTTAAHLLCCCAHPSQACREHYPPSPPHVQQRCGGCWRLAAVAFQRAGREIVPGSAVAASVFNDSNWRRGSGEKNASNFESKPSSGHPDYRLRTALYTGWTRTPCQSLYRMPSQEQGPNSCHGRTRSTHTQLPACDHQGVGLGCAACTASICASTWGGKGGWCAATTSSCSCSTPVAPTTAEATSGWCSTNLGGWNR